GVPHEIAHGIEHAVAVVTGERDGLGIEHADEARVAALVRHRRSALVIDAGEKEHVAALDEGAMLRRNLGLDDAALDAVGEPAGVETVLQLAMARAVQSAHIRLSPRHN